MTPSISVVVPVKNDERRIGRCLEAVFHQTLPPSEVIVVDGHSGDRTVEAAQRFPVKLVYEEHGTIGGARQVGVDHATGDYIAFTDSDCIPDRAWLGNLLPGFQPGIVGVGGGTRNIGTGLWEESIALALDSFLGSAGSVQDRVLDRESFVRSISGCNSMYRKEDILAAGGFDVSLSVNEDTELNGRLLPKGRLLYTPRAIVLHDQQRDLPQFCRRMFSFGQGRGSLRLVDLQIIPPLSLVLLPILLILSPLLILLPIVFYLAVIITYSIYIALHKKRQARFMATLPPVFLLEHLSYSAGFWRGLLGGKR